MLAPSNSTSPALPFNSTSAAPRLELLPARRPANAPAPSAIAHRTNAGVPHPSVSSVAFALPSRLGLTRSLRPADSNRPVRRDPKLLHQLEVRHDALPQQLQLHAPPLHRHRQFLECAACSSPCLPLPADSKAVPLRTSAFGLRPSAFPSTPATPVPPRRRTPLPLRRCPSLAQWFCPGPADTSSAATAATHAGSGFSGSPARALLASSRYRIPCSAAYSTNAAFG